MGLFGKIKNILFEDDEEFDEMPVYTKEEVKESPKKMVTEEQKPVVNDPIKTSNDSYFANVKRDIDFSYEEREVLSDVVEEQKEVIQPTSEVVQPPKVEEKKPVFLSFDEEEFERLNSRVVKNENRIKKEVKQNTSMVSDARRANNNFSATSTTRDTNPDRYKLNATTKKTFTPSPIISPVYGILDKNYTKEDIVDKKGGLKREKIIKPIVKKEENITIEQAEINNKIVEMDIDSVRKKAYGELEELENTLTKIETPKLKEDIVEDIPDVVEVVDTTVDIDINTEVNNSIEDELEMDFPKVEESNELDEIVETVIQPKVEEKVEKKDVVPKTNPKILDDLEKTSTLQILDDIEKELNSIKPISRDVNIVEDEIEESPKNDTLEKDLFNLIDSMYVEGEEEEEDDYR